MKLLSATNDDVIITCDVVQVISDGRVRHRCAEQVEAFIPSQLEGRAVREDGEETEGRGRNIKSVKTLNKKEAHPEILEDLFLLSNIFLDVEKKLSKKFIRNALDVVSNISSIRANNEQIMVQKCQYHQYYIKNICSYQIFS
mgnify:CR=1 FL=1